MKFRSVLFGFSVVLVGSLHGMNIAEAQGKRVTPQEFAAAFGSPDSRLRHSTWRRLNPEDTKEYRWLLQILKRKSWFDRDGAAQALATAASPKAFERMLKALKKDKNRFVRQGMAVALAAMNDDRIYPELYPALDDRDPFVRRVVVHSLRVHKKPEAVTALVEQFQKEKDPIVKSFLQDALNELTQAYQGPDPRAWMAWWREAQKDPDYKLGEIDAEAKAAAEELGRKLKTRKTISSAVTLLTSERGSADGVPLLVIPPYSFSKEIMLPFLAELEIENKLFYIDLPPVNSFQGLQAVGNTGTPMYPIDELVDAFEKLRQETGQERFGLLACGMNSWIAMRYASLHPESVSHLIFVSPLSSNQAYGNATQRMEGTGKKDNDTELWHYALTRRVNTQTGESHHDAYHREQGEAKPEGEDESLARREWSSFFANPQDSLLSVLYDVRIHRMGAVIIPDFKCFQEPRRNIPTLVIVGKHALHASVDDCQQIAKHYDGVISVYPNAGFLPFAENGPRFFKEVSGFLKTGQGRAPAPKKAKRRGRKGKPSS